MYKVLIVDDERMIREDLRDFVQWDVYGFNDIALAKNGLEAKRLMEESQPDLVLIDINMPKMGGLELIEWIRSAEISCHIVVISAYSEFQYAQKAISYGVHEYVLKPISYSEISQIVKHIAEQLNKETAENAKNHFINATKEFNDHLLIALRNGQRSRAHKLVEDFFNEDSIAKQRMEILSFHFRNTVFEVEVFFNDLNPLLYATKQAIFLELLGRTKKAASINDLDKLAHYLIDNSFDLSESIEVSEGSKEFSKLKFLIKSHLTEDISLDWLAERVYMSSNYLSVLFKKETGENFNEFLTRERMMLARTLLSKEDKKINEISVLVGYQNYRSFNRAFKNYFGFTPSEFRERYVMEGWR